MFAEETGESIPVNNCSDCGLPLCHCMCQGDMCPHCATHICPRCGYLVCQCPTVVGGVFPVLWLAEETQPTEGFTEAMLIEQAREFGWSKSQLAYYRRRFGFTKKQGRKPHRGEKSLNRMHQEMVKSARMERLLFKLTEKLGVPMVAPEPVPVVINPRLKASLGMAYHNQDARIEVSFDFYSKMRAYTKDAKIIRSTLWHETLHYVVSTNYPAVEHLMTEAAFEKLVYAYGINDGSHGSWTWKLSCEDGWWYKSTRRRDQVHCSKCKKILVSPAEYGRLKKASQASSKVLRVNMEGYRPWKSNKKIVG